MHEVRFIDPAGSLRHGEWNNGRPTASDRQYELNDVQILPPVEPTKIVCVGLNYHGHAEESDFDLPERPLLFVKTPNAVAAHGAAIPLAFDEYDYEFEAELGVIVGEQCRNVDAESAMDAVAGFTCIDDVSNRTEQYNEQNWVRGKTFDSSAPMGPVVATPDEVPETAAIELRLNGEVKQRSTRDDLIFSVPELVEEITGHITLEAGDVIATGTPSGVGPLADGDTVEVDIEGVGRLEHDAVDDSST